jgi:hypothetical protein
MFKRKAKAKAKAKVYVEPFDDAGEIQVVPIDTVVGDGEYNPEEDDAGKYQSQGSCVGKCARCSGCICVLTRTLSV